MGRSLQELEVLIVGTVLDRGNLNRRTTFTKGGSFTFIQLVSPRSRYQLRKE